MNDDKIKSKKTVGDPRSKGVISDLNRSVQALASHLCIYADVLRQCSWKAGTR
jgi:hypothetical protein